VENAIRRKKYDSHLNVHRSVLRLSSVSMASSGTYTCQPQVKAQFPYQQLPITIGQQPYSHSNPWNNPWSHNVLGMSSVTKDSFGNDPHQPPAKAQFPYQHLPIILGQQPYDFSNPWNNLWSRNVLGMSSVNMDSFGNNTRQPPAKAQSSYQRLHITMACPAGFFMSKGSNQCFKYIPGEVNWDDARRRCHAEGLQMAMPEND
ncbi:unnamed protein product, partial [Meganyctiphanes norvegica]